MIDTVRLTGYGQFYKFKMDYERFIGYRRKDGTEKITDQVVENKKGKYVARYSPSTDIMHVEFNLSKLLFERNVYNYAQNVGLLKTLLSHAAAYFFSGGDCFVSRVDIGGVTTYADNNEAYNVLNSMRHARPTGSRITKFKHQNYSDSVFYYTKNWSIKIYNKGVESGELKEMPQFKEFKLHDTLRFEKTYRFNEFARLGKSKGVNSVTPYFGVPLRDFDLGVIFDDFYSVFRNWDFVANGTIKRVGKRGVQACLAAMDAKGILSEAEAERVVSSRSMRRYRVAKQQMPDFNPRIVFQNNLSNKMLHKLNYAITFGLSEFFN